MYTTKLNEILENNCSLPLFKGGVIYIYIRPIFSVARFQNVGGLQQFFSSRQDARHQRPTQWP